MTRLLARSMAFGVVAAALASAGCGSVPPEEQADAHVRAAEAAIVEAAGSDAPRAAALWDEEAQKANQERARLQKMWFNTSDERKALTKWTAIAKAAEARAASAKAEAAKAEAERPKRELSRFVDRHLPEVSAVVAKLEREIHVRGGKLDALKRIMTEQKLDPATDEHCKREAQILSRLQQALDGIRKLCLDTYIASKKVELLGPENPDLPQSILKAKKDIEEMLQSVSVLLDRPSDKTS